MVNQPPDLMSSALRSLMNSRSSARSCSTASRSATSSPSASAAPIGSSDQANFHHGNYKGCDLRGNDLSTVTGVNNLGSVAIDRYQLTQLAEAMAAQLNITFGDELHAE